MKKFKVLIDILLFITTILLFDIFQWIYAFGNGEW